MRGLPNESAGVRREKPLFRWNVSPATLAPPVPRELVLCVANVDYDSLPDLVVAYEQAGVEGRRVVVVADLKTIPDAPYYALKSQGVLVRHVDDVASLSAPSPSRTRLELELTPVFRSTLNLLGAAAPLPSRQLDYEPSPFVLSEAQLDELIVRVQSPRYESLD